MQTLFSYLIDLFDSNESTHMSDEELEQIIRQDWQNNPSVMASLKSKKHSSTSRVRVWRSMYNRGLLGPPRQWSFRYCNGLPVNRWGNNLSRQAVIDAITSTPTDIRNKECQTMQHFQSAELMEKQ